MNDRLMKLRSALHNADPDALGRIARSCLDAWAEVDAAKNRENNGGYEVGFYTTCSGRRPEQPNADTWMPILTGSRDFCVGVAQGRQMDCDVPDHYRARSLSGFEVWPIWGRELLDGEGEHRTQEEP